jgi:hypothetical protein
MSRWLYIFPLSAMACLFAPLGCVTAGEAKVSLSMIDADSNRSVRHPAVLMKIYREGVEKQGAWWVVEEGESRGRLVARRAGMSRVENDAEIQQEGKVVALIGPYMYAEGFGWEYWLFTKGYQPENFHDRHLQRAYEQGKPLEIRLLPLNPGDEYSDEHVLDGARRLLDVAELIYEDNLLQGVLNELIEEVKKVRRFSIKPRHREDAGALLEKLEALRTKRFGSSPEAAADTTSLPEKTYEPTRPLSPAEKNLDTDNDSASAEPETTSSTDISDGDESSDDRRVEPEQTESSGDEPGILPLPEEGPAEDSSSEKDATPADEDQPADTGEEDAEGLVPVPLEGL